jgi:hypothetical protein
MLMAKMMILLVFILGPFRLIFHFRLTPAFASARDQRSENNEQGDLGRMLSRRQLQGVVRRADGEDIASQI